MAGEWLKFDKSTPDKPEVFAIATQLRIEPDAVVGKLFRVWSWFDTHTSDGHARGVTFAFLDRLAGITGMSESMQSVGWLCGTNCGVSLPNFGRHNGETAKTRALNNARKAKWRKGSVRGNGPSVTKPGHKRSKNVDQRREEKRREEKDQKHIDHRADDRGDGFDEFWSAYPRKVGKANALKAWRKIDRSANTVKDIMAAIAVQRESEQWCKGGGQFIPHPATWLNGQRWEDEISKGVSEFQEGVAL